MSDSMTNLRAAIARVRADMPDWHDTELHAAMTIVCAAAERAATPVAMRHVTGREEAITHAVSRFLQWELPRTFGPDCGISFDGRKPDQWNPVRQWPVGTNLFTADEARAMFDYCLPTTLSHVEPIPPASASEPTRHPCGHLIVSDECVACVKPASEPQADTKSAPSTCWLIERGQKEFHTPTIWYAGKSSHPDDARYNGRWTENANRAIRFSTQSECEATVYNEFMRYWGDKRVNCHASEHVFLSQELTYSAAIIAERTRCAAIARAHGAEDVAAEIEHSN